MSEIHAFGKKENNNNKKLRRYIGIDLGTTNSCVSVVREGTRPEVIPIDGKRTLPSCIMLNKDGSLTVGKKAYEHRYLESAWYSGKRDMGNSITKTLVNGDKTLTLTPEEFSAELLKYMIKSVEPVIGDVEGIVVTVPANFNNDQLLATEKACALAGYPVKTDKDFEGNHLVKLLKEPTAGAICAAAQETAVNKNVLVYDLGGGTFDVSVVSAKTVNGTTEEDVEFLKLYRIESEVEEETEPIVSVISTRGDMQLGGDDLDGIITDKLLADEGLDASNYDQISIKELILKVERAKKNSGRRGLVDVSQEFELISGGKETHKFSITSEILKESTAIIFDRTKKIVDLAISDCYQPIDSIILVGGSTKNEYLKELLRESYSGINVSDGIEPDESVALGAGIWAHNEGSRGGNMQVFDKIPQPIGILIYSKTGKKVKKLLGRDTIIPSSVTKTMKTVDSGASILSLKFFEGESENVYDCKSIGEVKIPFDNKEAETKSVDITFSININGMMEVSTIIDKKRTVVPLVRQVSDVDNIPSKFKKWVDLLGQIPDSEPAKPEFKSAIFKAIGGDIAAKKVAAKYVRELGKKYGVLGR